MWECTTTTAVTDEPFLLDEKHRLINANPYCVPDHTRSVQHKSIAALLSFSFKRNWLDLCVATFIRKQTIDTLSLSLVWPLRYLCRISERRKNCINCKTNKTLERTAHNPVIGLSGIYIFESECFEWKWISTDCRFDSQTPIISLLTKHTHNFRQICVQSFIVPNNEHFQQIRYLSSTNHLDQTTIDRYSNRCPCWRDKGKR